MDGVARGVRRGAWKVFRRVAKRVRGRLRQDALASDVSANDGLGNVAGGAVIKLIGERPLVHGALQAAGIIARQIRAGIRKPGLDRGVSERIHRVGDQIIRVIVGGGIVKHVLHPRAAAGELVGEAGDVVRIKEKRVSHEDQVRADRRSLSRHSAQ